MKQFSPLRRRVVLAAVTASVTAFGLVACAPGEDSSAGAGDESYALADLEAALEEGGEIDLWAWGFQYEGLSKEITAHYPNVTVNLLNPGTGGDTMTKLQNAVAAGSGIPDVVMMEYKNLVQFTTSDSLLPLDGYGIDFDAYSPAGSIQVADKHMALPMDSGPFVLFYRQDIFDAAGVEVPTTWDEYREVAEAIQAHDPNVSMSWHSQAGVEAYMWQAGATPFVVDGDSVGIDLTSEPVQRWGNMWNGLIDDGLIDTTITWLSPEWTAKMEEGGYASWVGGAWAVGTLQNRFPGQSGLWRAAPAPQYDPNEVINGVDGGSGVVVPKGTDTPLLSVAVAHWMSTSEEAQEFWVSQAGIPMTTKVQTSSDWLDAEYEFYGGQQVNHVIADAMNTVGEGWSYLPFHAYAAARSADFVAPEMTPGGSLVSGFEKWEAALEEYAVDQGFSLIE